MRVLDRKDGLTVSLETSEIEMEFFSTKMTQTSLVCKVPYSSFREPIGKG